MVLKWRNKFLFLLILFLQEYYHNTPPPAIPAEKYLFKNSWLSVAGEGAFRTLWLSSDPPTTSAELMVSSETFAMATPHPRIGTMLSAPRLMEWVRTRFGKIVDRRRECKVSLVDALMSGLAVFGLKYPSLLKFDDDREEETLRPGNTFSGNCCCTI